MRHTLPPGWEEKKLGELCDVLDFRRKPITRKDRTRGLYPYYGATGIVDFIDSFLFDEPLLLVGEDGARWGSGEPCAFIASGKYWVNNHAHVLKPKNCMSMQYLVYFLNYSDLTPYITGTTVLKLNQQKLRSISVPSPSLPEQKRIVEKLDKIFAAIDKAKSQTEKNLQNAKDVFSSYLNNIFNHPAHNWEEKKLGELCDVLDFRRKPITRKDRTRGLYPYYGATGIVDFIDSFLFDEPLLLVGEDGARWGSGEPCAFIASGKYWVNNHAHVLKPKNCMSMQYLVYFLNYSDLTPYITGTTVLKLNQQKLRSISVPSPSLPEQKRIVEKLDVLQSKTQELEKIYTQKLKDLEELKQAVLQQAFSGKL